ncbi:MAG: hypothetical protein ABFR33_09985, partial [Verrucomicrobiota bacterium]
PKKTSMFSYFIALFWIVLGCIFLWRQTSLLLKRIALMHIVIGVGIITTTISNNIEAQQKGTQSTQKLNNEKR